MRITESHLRNVIRSELKATLLEMSGQSPIFLEDWEVDENNQIIFSKKAYSIMNRDKLIDVTIPLDNMTKGEKPDDFGSYVLMRFVEGSKPLQYFIKKNQNPKFNDKLDDFVAANPM